MSQDVWSLRIEELQREIAMQRNETRKELGFLATQLNAVEMELRGMSSTVAATLGVVLAELKDVKDVKEAVLIELKDVKEVKAAVLKQLGGESSFRA